MPAGLHNITIEKGATFRITFTWRDSDGDLVDLTGYTARMQIRRSISYATADVSCTTENSKIALGDALGTVQITIPASETEDLAFTTGVYDLELIDADDFITRLVEGSVAIKPEVTR